MSLQEILNQHPVPWKHMQAGGPGNIVVLDARNQQVQLFALLEFTVYITAQIAGQAQQPNPAPQSEPSAAL